MRDYVVGYFNKKATKEEFVILATMDSKSVAVFVREFYSEAYARAGMETDAVMLASHEVPKNHRFAK